MTTTVDARRAIAMRTLMIDAAAAEVQHHLVEHGIPSILVKGRVLADWLYGAEQREYGDVDLLVSPADREQAVEALGELGYHHWLAGAARSEYGSHELELLRPGGPCIDLHHVLLGVTGDAQAAWNVLSNRTETASVAGQTITTLDLVARTMHLALHSAQDGPTNARSRHDLELGLAALTAADWSAAAGLAEAIGAHEAFASGLRMTEQGRRVADEIGVGRPHDVGLLLRAAAAPHESLQIEHFVRARTTGARTRLVLRKLWPTRAYMVGRTPAAARSRAHLLYARLHRMAGLPPRFVAALRSWRTASRESRSVAADVAPATEGHAR